jgi:hypothetical protein
MAPICRQALGNDERDREAANCVAKMDELEAPLDDGQLHETKTK